MRYINQLDYEHVPYPTDAANPDSEYFTNGTIEMAGCGLCCSLMMLDALTPDTVELEELRDLSVACHANMEPGTDMEILSVELAKHYPIKFTVSNDIEQLKEVVSSGGVAIANTGGDRDGHKSVFHRLGHYILVYGYQDGRFCVLDPAYYPQKFEGIDGVQVMDSDKVVFAMPEVIAKETDNRDPGYYLYKQRTK